MSSALWDKAPVDDAGSPSDPELVARSLDAARWALVACLFGLSEQEAYEAFGTSGRWMARDSWHILWRAAHIGSAAQILRTGEMW